MSATHAADDEFFNGSAVVEGKGCLALGCLAVSSRLALSTSRAKAVRADRWEVSACDNFPNGNGLCSSLSNGRLLGPNGAGTLLVASPIPEPGTLGLLGTGLFGLTGLVRRKRTLGT